MQRFASTRWIRQVATAGFSAVSLCAVLLVLSTVAAAQVAPLGEKSMDDSEPQLPSILKTVTIEQRLNQQVPLDLPFTDENGKSVRLGDYFGQRPVILTMVYYRCQILCPQEMNGLIGALDMLKLHPGKDFQIVAVSIDPTEGPDVARERKALYVKRFAVPGTAAGWHFLTGSEASIQALAHATGFNYARVPGPDGKMTQFAHASAIEIVTPEGKIAQYYLGTEYSPTDLKLGLVEASHHTIGTPVDNILTYCYRYNPKLNRHSLIVARIVQLGCGLTVLALGGFLIVSFRREITQADKG